MKARGLIIFDFSDLDGFKHAGEEQEKLEKLVKDYAEGNPYITFADCDLKERRGEEGRVDIKKMKFRNK